VEAVHQYLSVLESLNRTVAYRDGVKKQLGLILVSCKWHYWQDVTSDALLHYLHKLRTTPCVRPGQKVPDQGRSPATLNAYLRSAKGFCNWYADKLKTTSPLKKLKSFNEQVDRRRSRRILTDDELLKLLAATEAAPRRHKTKIKPLDRSALYRIAAYTGLRANELASLTPESFQMERIPPVVVVLAQNA
jgi:integrase